MVTSDETRTPPAQPPQAYAPTPAAPQPQQGVSGWMIAFAVVLVLALGGLAAAIISKGDSGSETATIPSVATKTTTVQNTTTVTTPAAPANVTIAPDVTLDASGSAKPVPTSTDEATTSTP